MDERQRAHLQIQYHLNPRVIQVRYHQRCEQARSAHMQCQLCVFVIAMRLMCAIGAVRMPTEVEAALLDSQALMVVYRLRHKTSASLRQRGTDSCHAAHAYCPTKQADAVCQQQWPQCSRQHVLQSATKQLHRRWVCTSASCNRAAELLGTVLHPLLSTAVNKATAEQTSCQNPEHEQSQLQAKRQHHDAASVLCCGTSWRSFARRFASHWAIAGGHSGALRRPVEPSICALSQARSRAWRQLCCPTTPVPCRATVPCRAQVWHVEYS